MVSVVIIGKNEGERLARCFESIPGAMRPFPYELIYVDSRSEDDSLSIALRFHARTFLLQETSPTAGLGRAVGAGQARGDTVLFLDGDMELLPGFMQKALPLMLERQLDGICGIRQDVYLRDGQEVGQNPNYFDCRAERVCPEFGGAILLRREALMACENWAGEPIACEEAELHARLLSHGARILEIPMPMIRHTDAVRDARSPLRTFFSHRRLGEGQALAAALARKSGKAYIAYRWDSFSFYLLDWIGLALLLLLGLPGIIFICALQGIQLGFYLARRTPRRFVSQKLFFFYLPAGLCTYRRRSLSFEEVHHD